MESQGRGIVNYCSVPGKAAGKKCFSLLDVDEVVFETDGKFTIIQKVDGRESHLLVNNGEIEKEKLEASGYDKSWLEKQLKDGGYNDMKNIFCAEYTPERDFYIIDMQGNIRNENQKDELEKVGEKDREGIV